MTRRVLVSHKLRDIRTGNHELDAKLNEWQREFVAQVFERLRYHGQYSPDHEITGDELTAGINPTDFAYPYSPEIDVRRYGVDASASDNSAAIQNAIDALPENGGALIFPAGVFTCASTIDLENRIGIKIRGAGCVTGGAQRGTALVFSGTSGSRFINARSTVGLVLEDMQIQHSSGSFTNYLVDFSHSSAASDTAYVRIRRCFFGSSSGVSTAIGLNLDKVIIASISECTFANLEFSIAGQDEAGGSYCNAIQIDKCTFLDNDLAPVRYGGEAWTIRGCTFENLNDGTAGAVVNTANQSFITLLFEGNWLGDVTDDGGEWLSVRGSAIMIIGNRFGGEISNTNAIVLNAVNGWHIAGNTFIAFTRAIEFGAATCSDGYEGGNHFTSVSNKFTNTANQDSFSLAADGYALLPFGVIAQWGDATVTTGTPNAISFPIAFPNAAYNVQSTLYAPVAGGNTVYNTSLSASGVTLNVAGTAGSNTVHWMAIGS